MQNVFFRSLGMMTLGLVSFTLAEGTPVSPASPPLRIEAVIRAVCANSDSVKMMRETVIKSSKMVKEKWSNAMPVVSATLFGGRTYGSLSGGGGSSGGSGSRSLGKAESNEGVRKEQELSPQDLNQVVGKLMGSLMTPRTMNVYSSSISITQPLYTFGKIGTAVEVADAFSQAAQSSCARNLQLLELQGLDAFYRVVLSEMALSVSERSLSRKRELSDLLERNFKMGAGSKAQLLATLADVKSEQSLLIGAKENVMVTRMMLNALMGEPIDAPIKLDTSTVLPELMALALPTKAAALDTAISRREDLRALEKMKEANEGGAKRFRATYYPSSAETGSLSFSDTAPKGMVDWDKRSWMVGVAMQWTLFDGFSNSSKAAQYASDSRKLSIAQKGIIKMLEIEVTAALEECAAADNGYGASMEMLAAAQESYELTNENFKQGSGQFVELQLAQERLRQAEMGFVNARYRQLRSRAALRVAMGTDIVKLEVK